MSTAMIILNLIVEILLFVRMSGFLFYDSLLGINEMFIESKGRET